MVGIQAEGMASFVGCGPKEEALHRQMLHVLYSEFEEVGPKLLVIKAIFMTTATCKVAACCLFLSMLAKTIWCIAF